MLEAVLVKNLISLHHLDPTVLVQNPSEAGRDDNRYKANLAVLPEAGTRCTLVLEAARARPAQPAEALHRIHVLIHGRVQGVGFRAFTQRNARRLGIAGWVRNLPTGEVELVAAGGQETLAEFEQTYRKGPRGASVEKVDFLAAPAPESFAGFEIRPTPEPTP
ncbi:MAG: acylphosphatase [Kiritimatiellae bacterium]|nr:acylphosphatase [Kiritimatiellia bacterium]